MAAAKPEPNDRVIRIGLFDNKPMCYTDSNGKPAGIFVSVLEYTAAREDWRLEYIQGKWPELRRKLEQGEIDILPSAAVSEERAKRYTFNAVDVFTNWAEVYVARNSDIYSLLDLKGKRIATLQQSIYTTGPEGILALNDRFRLKAKIRGVGSYTEALHEVRQGRADAAVVNRLAGVLYGNKYGLKRSGIVFAPVEIRFALNPKNPKTPKLVEALDRHLIELRRDNDSVYHRTISEALGGGRPMVEIVPRWAWLTLILGAVLLGFFLAGLVLLRWQVNKKTMDLLAANAQLQMEMMERQEAKKALQESQKRFQSLAENSSDWIWEFDENDIFTYASPRIEDLLGYLPEEIVGKSCFDLIPEPERERAVREFSVIKAAQQPFAAFENVNQHKDGRLVTLESSGVPIFDRTGIFRGYRGIDRDISDRKNMETQLRHAHKMEAIGTLAGGIAHDFNNILTAILGYASLAREEIPEEHPARQTIAGVLKAGRRAKELVRHILAFSRETDQQLGPVNIKAIVKEVLKLLRATIPATIEIRSHVDPECGVIWADPTQVHQIIMNLCTNAAQAMEATGGILTVGLGRVTELPGPPGSETDPAPGSYVRLSVCDTGPGIEPAIRKRIFDPYFTTKEVGKGSGMGLAVVHGIVENHGGAIRVESEPGKGAAFHVFFPQSEEPLEEQEAVAQTLPLGTEHILFVDDEELLTAIGQQLLERLGYTVTTASSGGEALRLFQGSPETFALVVTDQTMPGLTGAELAQRLLAIKASLPIILCTGYSSQIDEEKAKALGIQKFLLKPVGRVELARTVRALLDAGTRPQP